MSNWYVTQCRTVTCFSYIPSFPGRDANGLPVFSPVYFNPEYLPLDNWPGGQFVGQRFYLSELKRKQSLWHEFKKDTFNPDGSRPRWAGRDRAPVDPPEVIQKPRLLTASRLCELRGLYNLEGVCWRVLLSLK